MLIRVRSLTRTCDSWPHALACVRPAALARDFCMPRVLVLTCSLARGPQTTLHLLTANLCNPSVCTATATRKVKFYILRFHAVCFSPSRFASSSFAMYCHAKHKRTGRSYGKRVYRPQYEANSKPP
eukprot:scaffold147469_cov33-Tisochrysis_lutea.AAC.1